MRFSLPLTAAVLLVLAANVQAQTVCPSTQIKNCPAEGCGSWDKHLNVRKNSTSFPHQQPPTPMTVNQIAQLAYPAEWFIGKNRSQIEELGEGKAVQVTAYLIDVEEGKPTSANCKISVNDLLVLVSEDVLNSSSEKDRKPASVTAEITPRVRNAHTPNWTRKKLKLLIKRKAVLVRIKGLLLLNTEDIGKGLVRATDWEIHPVLEIQVCAMAQCLNETDWQNLDDLKIPAPIRIRDRGIIKP